MKFLELPFPGNSLLKQSEKNFESFIKQLPLEWWLKRQTITEKEAQMFPLAKKAKELKK